jgi:high-affinity nickel permease
MHEAIFLLLTVLFWSSAFVARRLHKTSLGLATMLYSFGKIHASPAKKKKKKKIFQVLSHF